MLRKVFAVWPSLLFTVMMLMIPWQEIRVEPFSDIENYIYRIEIIRWHGPEYFYFGETWIDYLKAEYLWFFIIYLIAYSPLDPIIGLKIISAISSFVYHRFLALRIGDFLAIVFLINPIVIDLLFSQIRSALAFSLFLIAIMFVGRSKKIHLLIPIFVYIHTSMFFLYIIFTASKQLATIRLLKPKLKVLIAACAAIAVALIVTKIVPLVLSAIGDRRIIEDVSTRTGLYVIFWLIWGGSLVEAAGNKIRLDWQYIYAVVICVSIPLMTLMGFPGFRFLALSYPIVIGSMALISKDRKIVASLALLAYQFLLFSYWIG